MPAQAAPKEPFDAEVDVAVVLYTSEDESFGVLIAESDDADAVTIAGPVAHLEAGMRARIGGHWETHARHGLQVRANVAFEVDPDNAAATRKYLMTISGIGDSRARKLLARHGDDVFTAIDRDPEACFASLPGIGRKAAARAADSWRERRTLRGLFMLLAPHGAGWLATRLQASHGAMALALVRENPYRLTEEHGVGFLTADAIARGNGLPPDSPARIRAALLHALQEAESRGHTFLPAPELGRRAADLAGAIPPSALGELAGSGAIVIDGEAVSRRATAEAEAAAAARLAELARGEPVIDAAAAAASIEQRTDDLTAEQRSAVEAAFSRRLSVVTGGPGTGKTTLVRAIATTAEEIGTTLALCAPTGRAARRLEDATGKPAVTIHRLLEWVPGEGPARGPLDPIDCDLLVVDESSMLSLAVAGTLLDAVGDRTHVVLVGDADQLPPVGAGKPFADVIDSESVPVARLSHVFRQAARSLIVQASHAINRGERPRATARGDEVRDFFFIERRREADAADEVVGLAAGRLASHFDLDPVRDVQVLAPQYRGAVGVDELNLRLRAELNPDGERCLDGPFRVGDKLIQTRNDYEAGLMNGQLVIVTGASESNGEAGRLIVETDEGELVRIGPDRWRDLRLAYAISVHKSQGCEVPAIVVPVHSAHAGMLTRNLLYTALTRARQACVLVGQPEAIDRAVRRADAFRRNTRLAGMLRAGS